MESEKYEIISSRNIELFWQEGKAIDTEKAKAVEEIWQEALKKKKMYDNPLLSLLKIETGEKTRIYGK